MDWIRSFDASGYPVRIASEVKDFEPEAVVGPKDARRLERNVVLAVAAAREAWARRGRRGRRSRAAGILVGSAIGGVMGVLAQNEVLEERGHTRVSPWFLPNVLVDSASGQIAIDLGLRGPNYAPVSACATGSHAVGEGAELIRRGDADVVLAGGTESCMHPVILAGFTRHARPRRRGGGPDAVPRGRSTRPAPGSSWGRARACSCSRSSSAPRRAARGSTPRCSATAPRTTRTTWRSPIPESVGVAEMMRAALERAGRRARAGRIHQRARDVDSAGRSRGDEGDQGRLRRARVRRSPCPRRSRCSGICSVRRARSRR